MEKTIYNVYVPMESQEQCDRMKQLCIENDLSIWDDEDAFLISTKYKRNFFCFNEEDEFYIINPYNGVYWLKSNNKSQVTEQEFIELLKTKK